jgi:hypothetical protein
MPVLADSSVSFPRKLCCITLPIIYYNLSNSATGEVLESALTHPSAKDWRTRRGEYGSITISLLGDSSMLLVLGYTW